MKKIIAMLLALAMLFSLAGCGGEEDPHAGKYVGVSATMMGFTMPMAEIYEGETWVELKSGGKGTMMLDGDDFRIKWALDGEEITISIQGEDSVGTLKGSVITVDLMNMGCVMTFEKVGGSIADKIGSIATYNHAGYWEMVRIDSDDPDSAVTEEDMSLLQSLGMTMYMELLEDGTGIMYMEEEMALNWQDGKVTYVEDGLTVNYTIENGELVLDMIESKLVFRKGEKPVYVASEMEQAGITEFMELGVPYMLTTACSEDPNFTTTVEITVTDYQVFESAPGYEAKEGYEWRTAQIQVRCFDYNARYYGIDIPSRTEDYYTTMLHDDTVTPLNEDGSFESYTLMYEGKKMEAYHLYKNNWGEWHTNDKKEREVICTTDWAFLVPVGYDGCVVGVTDSLHEKVGNDYITSYSPEHFLLFRLN